MLVFSHSMLREINSVTAASRYFQLSFFSFFKIPEIRIQYDKYDKNSVR